VRVGRHVAGIELETRGKRMECRKRRDGWAVREGPGRPRGPMACGFWGEIDEEDESSLLPIPSLGKW